MKVKISKSYKRKVSLRYLTSQYDNIECGTTIGITANCEDEKKINKLLDAMSKKVLKDTERDIANAIFNIQGILKDESNNSMVGEGINLKDNARTQVYIPGLDELIEQENKLKIPSDLSEE